MTIYSAPLREMHFVLHELWGATRTLEALPAFDDVSAEIIDTILAECAKFCESVLYPLNQIGDRQGCRFEEGRVITPAGFPEAYRQFGEAGWCGITADPDFGGQGLPHVIDCLVSEMVGSCNLSFGMYPSLGQGAILAIAKHGSEAQKRVYLPRLIRGEWQGTMCLTEANAGSDLGLLRTKAHPNQDGSYSITGTKIFISAGDHDMAENHVHLVLARLADAPPGSRGISMFLVPKFLVQLDGTLGARNSVVCGSIEHKMGLKGSATCLMNFDEAQGWLIGQKHMGLAAMFTMMNKERLFVACQGISQAEIAYQSAADYAKGRLQGRAAQGLADFEKPADPIICHPDIRNKLLYARSITEGLRALAVWANLQVDVSDHHPDPAIRQTADDHVALLTPILKAAATDFASEIANLCLQVFGGHGYIAEYGMEQLVRDVRITQIYEGTNAIQALDLVCRKIVIDKGRLVKGWFKFMDDSLIRLSGAGMHEFALPVQGAAARLKSATDWLAEAALTDPDARAAAAGDYLRLFALTTLGWCWVCMVETAQARGVADDPFYGAKIHLGRYYIAKVLPQTLALGALMRNGSSPLMDLPEAAF